MTEQEIGKEQFEKAKTDRARFRGIPGQAYQTAQARGEQAAWRMRMTNDPSHANDESLSREAVMYAQQAFRAWRAYRIMKG